MKFLKEWLENVEEKCRPPVYELTIMLNKLDNHEVAIKAANTFPITYALITHVRSVFCSNDNNKFVNMKFYNANSNINSFRLWK